MPAGDLLWTNEAAKLFGVTPRTIRKWVEAGRIPHVVLPSGHLRFRRGDLEAMLRAEPVA